MKKKLPTHPLWRIWVRVLQTLVFSIINTGLIMFVMENCLKMVMVSYWYLTLWGNLYLWSGLLIVSSLTSFKWIIYKFLTLFLNFKWTDCWNKLKLIRDIKMCFCYFSVECRWLMLVFIVLQINRFSAAYLTWWPPWVYKMYDPVCVWWIPRQ